MSVNQIGGQTNVVIPMSQLLKVVAAFVVASGLVLWTVLTFTISGMRDDISGMRSDIHDLTKSVQDAPKQLSEAQMALTKDIGDLRSDLKIFKDQLSYVQVSVDGLSNKLPQPPRKRGGD